MTEVNADLSLEILEFFQKHPELHDQADFMNPYEADKSKVRDVPDLQARGCGTTRCVAGEAVILGAPELLRVEFNESSGYVEIYLAKPGEEKVDKFPDWDTTAQKLLGLDDNHSYTLFYIASDEEALEALKYMAEGKVPDWKVIFNDESFDIDTVLD